MKKFTQIAIILALFIPFFTANAQINENFDPNYIISDDEVLDSTSMTKEEIRQFLVAKNGYIAGYSCPNPDGKMMTAAEIIYDRAVTNQVNPKFLLVLLQKEQGLIEDPNPSQGNLDWATGYGCPDGGGCNTRWKGLWKQVNSASLQFRDYMDNPQLYTYRAGGTYTFTNPYSAYGDGVTLVTPVNQATAALYNYTPHVFNGNYNFYILWHKYFDRNSYPDGSLLQAKGEPGVWLIQDGKKRPFTSRGALTSRFDEKKIIAVEKSDLDKYEKGVPIKYAQYSLLQSPAGENYLIVDDKKRLIENSKVFKAIGFNPDELITVSWDDINSYTNGKPVTATSTYPTGALVQNKQTGGIYWVSEGEKAPLLDRIFLTTKFKHKKIQKADTKELDTYPTISAVKFDDGDLLKSTSANEPGVYLISNGEKRAFNSGETFEKLGYKWENITNVPSKILSMYPTGLPIKLTNIAGASSSN
jgi:hypothetical protein